MAQMDVTKFLGIPVDGNKSDMMSKLKSKGFTQSPYAGGQRDRYIDPALWINVPVPLTLCPPTQKKIYNGRG